MVVEGRDLVDLGHRKLHLVGERDQMRGREMAVMVLDAVQILDQEIAPARRVFQEGAYFFAGLGIDAAPFGRAAHARAFRGLLFFLGPRSNSVVREYMLPPGSRYKLDRHQ